MLLVVERVLRSAVVLKLFKNDRRGAIAIMFAVSLVPMLALFAFTVDYGVASLTKAKLDAAADSSVLVATVAAANAYVGNGGDLINARAAGKSAGEQWYNGQVQMAGLSMNPAPPPPTIDVTLENTTFNATLNYTATSPSYFFPLFGRSFYDLSGVSNSTYTLPGYLDLIMMIDNSPSMTIIADLANWPRYADYIRTKNVPVWQNAAQSKDCVFACHDVGTVSDTSASNTDLYYIAKEYANNIGVNLLRIDVVGAAIQSVLQAVQATQASDHYRVGLYTFSDAAQEVYALGNDFRNAAAAAKAILPLASRGNGHRTDFPKSVSAMIDNNYLTKAGDGLSSASPKKVLLIITDGTNNVGENNISPFNTNQCQIIKNLDISVYIMYTQYYPIRPYYPNSSTPDAKGRETWYDNVYQNYVLPLQKPTDQIEASLRSCASTPDKYYSVTDAPSINLALKKILTGVLAQPGRFTQ